MKFKILGWRFNAKVEPGVTSREFLWMGGWTCRVQGWQRRASGYLPWFGQRRIHWRVFSPFKVTA